ncbi:MAG: hypothetical protein NC218_09870 [Acetobacter sp.]|nr:hypothetical protein [Acetobacter sp.]
MADRKVKTDAELKQQLEDAMKRLRPMVVENKGNESVLGRLEKFAKRPDEARTPENKKEKTKPLGLNGLAKKGNALDKKAREAGIDISRPSKDKDEKDDKDKKKEKEKENTPEKQEAKMKEMFSKVKLPSGMEIHQEGPQWVLVSKDGKQRTDVTDVMNTIDKFNQNVDAANEQNRMQNAAQSGVDKAADINKKDQGLTISETSGRVQMVGEVLPKVAGTDGQPVFKPEDVKAVAETAISFSNEKALLEKLKDPKALEEMRKREKNNERTAEEMARKRQLEQSRGGR